MSFLGKTPDIHQFGFIYTDKLKRCMKFSEDHSKGLDIFLRIKPYDLNTQVPFKVLNENSIEVSEKDYRGEPRILNYDFTHIFGPDTTQPMLFHEAIKDYITHIQLGQSLLLAAYGTSNAGKTYTILGRDDNPGIIPRSLHYLFECIKSNLVGHLTMKPDKFSEIIYLNEEQRCEEINFKDEILNYIYHKKELSNRMHLEIENQDEVVTFSKDPISVWVSFAELYNDNVYDLLLKNDNKNQRQKLSLGEDKNGVVYIRGLKQVFIKNAQEALDILCYGQKQVSMGATKMNISSSRSHCIFKISLLNQATRKISSLTICDLAGCERLKKTLNLGDRLKESQKINSSLLSLRMCLQTIRNNQVNKNNKEANQLIPFRDSKLTRLLQHALTGQEKFTMIVNVNPDPKDFEETLHVFKFSAVTKRIMFTAPRRKSISRFSKIVENDENFNFVASNENIKELENEEIIKNLKSEMENMKTEYERKLFDQRKDLCAKYSEMMDNMRTMYRKQILDQEERSKNFNQFTFSKLNQYRENELKEKEEEFNDLHDKYLTLEMQLEEMELEKANVCTELNEEKALRMLQDNELDKHRTEISTLNNNLKDKIKLLDEAKMEYCQLIEDKDNLEALLNEKLTVLLNREEEIENLKLDNQMKSKLNLDLKNNNKELQLSNENLLKEMDNLKEQNHLLKNKINDFEMINISKIENKENEKSKNSNKYLDNSQFKVPSTSSDMPRRITRSAMRSKNSDSYKTLTLKKGKKKLFNPKDNEFE